MAVKTFRLRKERNEQLYKPFINNNKSLAIDIFRIFTGIKSKAERKKLNAQLNVLSQKLAAQKREAEKERKDDDFETEKRYLYFLMVLEDWNRRNF